MFERAGITVGINALMNGWMIDGQRWLRVYSPKLSILTTAEHRRLLACLVACFMLLACFGTEQAVSKVVRGTSDLD